MSLSVAIEKAKNADTLEGFSETAVQKLEKFVSEFASDLVSETTRLEAGRNSTSGTPEITAGMVHDANTLLRRGLQPGKRNWITLACRVASAVLAVVCGAMYDADKLQDGGYMLTFIVMVVVAILTTTASVLRN